MPTHPGRTFGIGETKGRLPLAWRCIFAMVLRPQIADSEEQERAVRQYIQKTAGTGSGSVDELHKLSTLRDKGDLSQEEFEKAKTKLLA